MNQNEKAMAAMKRVEKWIGDFDCQCDEGIAWSAEWCAVSIIERDRLLFFVRVYRH